MTVRLHSPVEGKQAGETYTGPNERYLLENGLAKKVTGNAGVTPGQVTGADSRTSGYTHPAESEVLLDTPVLDSSAFRASSTFDPKTYTKQNGIDAPDPTLIPNGHAPNPSIAVTRDYEPQTNASFVANPTVDGVLPEPVNPGVNPHA